MSPPPNSHPFQRIFDIMEHEFPTSSEDEPTKVFVVWGIKGIDRSVLNMTKKKRFTL